MAQYLKSRTTYSFFFITLSFVTLLISSIIEHFAPYMLTLVPYTLLFSLTWLLLGIMILPSYFTTPLRRITYYLINICALIFTLVLIAATIYILLIEILFLLIFYLISYRAYQSIRLSLYDVIISAEEYLESVTFNLMRLNQTQCLFNVVALFIIVLLPDFSTALYMLALVSSVIIQIRLHFKQHIQCSKIWILTISMLSSIGALSFAYFVSNMDGYFHAVLTAIIFIPYLAISYVLDREFKRYLKKYRYISA